MDLTETAVAVITTGPAYIAVWWAVRSDKREHVQAPARRAACVRHATCEQCGGRSTDNSPGRMTTWALAV